MPFIGELLFQFVPVAVLWLVFALVYLLVPNTRVRFDAALVGGMVGGSLWHLNNVFGFLYVSRVVTNSKIYGKPRPRAGVHGRAVFFLGDPAVRLAGCLCLSKPQILFAGATGGKREPARKRIHRAPADDARRPAFPARRTCGTLQQISAGLGIPTKLAQQVLQPLLAARLVTEIAGAEPASCPRARSTP